MVNVHLSEEEQVEALKKWWKENGKSVVAGVVIGLGAVFGWQAWEKHQRTSAEDASALFEQLSYNVANGSALAEQQARDLIQEHHGSVYAVFAALELARIKVGQGDLAAARTQLQWALNNAPDDSLRQIARLRLARVMLSEGDTQGAASVAAAAVADRFAAELAELRGDIALADGDLAAARDAYLQAIDSGAGNTELVQMKLDDLSSVTDS